MSFYAIISNKMLSQFKTDMNGGRHAFFKYWYAFVFYQ